MAQNFPQRPSGMTCGKSSLSCKCMEHFLFIHSSVCASFMRLLYRSNDIDIPLGCTSSSWTTSALRPLQWSSAGPWVGWPSRMAALHTPGLREAHYPSRDIREALCVVYLLGRSTAPEHIQRPQTTRTGTIRAESNRRREWERRVWRRCSRIGLGTRLSRALGGSRRRQRTPR